MRNAYAIGTLVALAVLATLVAGCEGQPDSPDVTVNAMLDSLERLDPVSMNALLTQELQISDEQVVAIQQYYETLRQGWTQWSIRYSDRNLNVTSQTADHAQVNVSVSVQISITSQGQTRTQDYGIDTVVSLRRVNQTWLVEDAGGLSFVV